MEVEDDGVGVGDAATIVELEATNELAGAEAHQAQDQQDISHEV